MSLKNPFAGLLEQQRNEEQRAALHALRDELGLRTDDALWHFVALIEQHFAGCCASAPTPSTRVTEPSPLVPRWVWWCAGMACQTVFAAACVVVGVRAAQRGTAVCGLADSSWIHAALALPAGWLAFAFVLPVTAFIGSIGWRLRAAGERIWGYGVLFVAVGCACVSALALWRLV